MDLNHRLVLFTHALCQLSYPAKWDQDAASSRLSQTAILQEEHHELGAFLTFKDAHWRAIKEAIYCGDRRQRAITIFALGRHRCFHDTSTFLVVPRLVAPHA
jgi:hypothetical protein